MHFTYCQPKEGADLQQGDILLRTEELGSLIKMYFPHFQNEKYVAFIVATQSCDLVRRSDGVGAPYITLCAIKSFSNIFLKEVATLQSPLLRAAEAVSSKHKDRLRFFIARLLNNNNPEYFYLHSEPESGLAENACAVLRLTVNLKTEHYDKIVAARRISLDSTFQAKLGWLIGNLYSRVGTEDWVPNSASSDEWQNMIDAIINESVFLVDDKKADAAKKKYKDLELDRVDMDGARKLINDVPIRNKKDEVVTAIVDQLLTDGLLTEENYDAVKRRLAANSVLRALVK